MSSEDNQRPLEAGITRDLRDRLSYGSYLQLDLLLSAQRPASEPANHDEMMFIVQHQVSELWMKLIIHELRLAIRHLQNDDLDPVQKILARVKQVQRQLFEQWSVLETLTPSEYARFRDALGPSSGFQSHQYRLIEFMLGNKNADMISVFAHDPPIQRELTGALQARSLYDEFLHHLARAGHAIPSHCIERDFSRAHVRTPELLPVFQRIYADVIGLRMLCANNWSMSNRASNSGASAT